MQISWRIPSGTPQRKLHEFPDELFEEFSKKRLGKVPVENPGGIPGGACEGTLGGNLDGIFRGIHFYRIPSETLKGIPGKTPRGTSGEIPRGTPGGTPKVVLN